MSDISGENLTGNKDGFVARLKRLPNFFGFMEEDNETYI
jgi:hypothetical protein